MSHYTHLTINERESILILLSQGKSIRYIARELNRSEATVSRELKRNSSRNGFYSPSDAQKKYQKRRKKCCQKRMLSDPVHKAYVQSFILDMQWSPEQISQRLKMENNPFQVSFTTIYRAINDGKLEEGKISHGARGIARKLRHRGKTRHKKGKKETRGKIKISHHIDERPEEANNRECIGHWEADTVAGKTGSSCLITITDRYSRFLLSKKVKKKSADEVKDGMIDLLSKLPKEKLRSVTPDRGKEFAAHEKMAAELGVEFYFPNPHAPWERGTNENTNGLIREYCPKSVDMESFDDRHFDVFTDKLNLRPRKCLGWKSPYEVFFNEVLHLT